MTARNGAAPLRRPARAACVLLALAGLWSATAQAQTTFVSNMENRRPNLFSEVLNGEPRSQPFRTGGATGGYTLHGIALHFSEHGQGSVGSGALSLTLRANAANGLPGNILHTLTNPSSVMTTGVNEFTAPPGVVLAADTDYHAVLEYSSGTGNPKLSWANADPAPSDGWDIPNRSHRLKNGRWGSFGFRHAMAVKGTEIVLPAVAVEPVASPVAEGTEAQFRVTRTEVTAGSLTVRYEVSESGDMVASGDEGAKSVDFGDGETETTVTVPTVGDAVHEADSAVTVTLTPDAAYSLGTATAEVTVEDDDNADPTGKPTIDDTTPVVGETLTADPSGIGDPDGLTSPGFAWQWIRVSGGTDTRIAGATAATYTVVAADEGATLKAEASFTDDDGTAETVASAATSAVEAVPLVTVAAGASVTEGTAAGFTLTRTGSTAAELAVQVTVSETGDMVASGDEGTRTVTFGKGSATATVTVPTQGDSADEADSTVTLAVKDGSGHDPGTPSTADVVVSDDDDPVVTVASDGDVTEGMAAGFTLTRAGDTAAALEVGVTVSETGDMVAAGDEGTKTATFAAGSATATVTVPTQADSASEPDSTVTVTVADGDGYVAGAPSEADVVVSDDDDPLVTVAAGASVTEGTAAGFTLSRTGSTAAALEVRVTVSETGDMVASGDEGTKTVRFSANAGTFQLAVPTRADSEDEPDSTVTVTVVSGSGYDPGTPSEADVTVSDDDVPVVTVASDGDVTEGAPARFTLTRDGHLAVALAVDVTVSETGGMVAPGDEGTRTVTFDANSATATVEVPTADDAVDEDNSTVTVTVVDGGDHDPGSPSEADVAVSDNDQASLAIDSPRVDEGDSGTADLVFTVTLDPVSDRRVTVGYADSGGGTAASGTDHEAVAGGTLTFAPGDSTKTVTVAVNGDDAFEDDETVVIRLSGATGGATIGTAEGTGTIVDDEVPGFSINSPSVVEGDGPGTASLVFTVTLEPEWDSEVSVRYEDSGNGTATSGADADYLNVSSAELVFAPGETRKSVTVRVNGDGIDELDETVEIGLGTPTGGAEILKGTGVGTIRDDDEATLAIDSPRAEEGDAGETSTLTFTVTLDPVSDREVTVAWADSGGGTATSGEDHEAVAGGTLTFAPGESGKTVAVTVTGDDVGEGNETVEIRLSGATGGAALGTATGTGTIVDNDVPQFSIDSPRVDEGDSGTSDLVFTVTLDPVSDSEVTVAWADSGGGTATSGADHAAAAGGTLTFAAGDSTRTVTVRVNGDGIDELDETVVIALSGATGGADIAIPTGTGTIADDDEAALEIDSPRVAEGDSGTSDLVFTVTLDPVSDRRVTVGYADSGTGTAASGADHEAVAGGTLTFEPGDSERTVTVAVTGDRIDEEDETVVIALSNPTGGATVATATGTGTIADDDIPSLAIDSPRVDEGDSGTSDLVFTVTLDPVSRQQVTVAWADSGGGTATSGTDHEAVAGGTLAFAPGESAKTVTVRVTGDDAVEGDETVVIALSNPTGGATVGTAAGTGTIVDDEAPELAIDSPRVAEGDSGTSDLVFTVTLTPAWDRRVTVAWADSGGGTATSGTDHEAVAGGTLAFDPGDTARTVTVAVNGDGIDEEDETVEIALSNPTGGATIGTATGAGTIADDEEAALLIGSPEVAEGDSGTSELVFAVTLAPVSDRRVTVDWADSGGGTATSGEDYEAVAGGTLAFAPGESGKTVTVAARGDGIDENDETVEIALSGATGGAAIGTGTGTGTIRDDDEAALSIDSPEVAEGDSGTTDLVFTVTLDPASDREVVVDFAVGGTAEAGRDHDAPEAGSVAFAPGETVQTLSFGVAGDGVFELDETVVVTLSDPTGGALLRRHRGTGVIRNDDARETSGPAVWVGSTSVVEGDGGPAELRFPVTLSEAADGPVSVDYTVTGAAEVRLAERDMRATTGTLAFAPGETAKTIVATVEGDREAESDGLVVVTLDSVTSAAGYEIGTGRGLGTVRDDDRRLSVEAADEAGTVTFTVALEPPTGPGDDLVTVDHETVVDGGGAVSGLLTFQHGETRRTVEVEAGDAAEVVELGLTGSTNVLLPEPRRTEHWLGARPVLSVSAPAPGSVKRPAVGETATVAFTVGLDRPWPAREPLEVGYVKAARDGEGEREESGTLAFAPGERGKTVEVEVGGETEAATVRLSGVDAARVSGDRDGWEARYDLGAGRGERRALALKYVLAATGRTVAANVVELVWERAGSHRSGDAGSHATVGGRPLTSGALASGGLAGLLGVGGVSGDAGGAERRHGPGGGSADASRRLALPDGRDLRGRTAFALSPGGDGGAAGGPVLWGRGTFTAIDSGGLDEDDDRIGAFSSEGAIFAAHLGLDRRFRDDLLAGVAVSRTVGDVDYAFGGGDGGGAVETTLTSAHPYVHWMSPTGLGVWGTAGYGRGSTEIADRDGLVGTDVEMTAVAAGVRDDLASVGGVGLAVKADAFHAVVSADGVEDELLEVEAAASRVRLALEGGSRRALAGGGELAGSFELGARLDEGDAERGAGADLALGFGYVLPHAGLEVRGRGSALLAHEESGFREWGLGLGLDWDPGVRGRGLRLRLAPSWGAPARGAAEAMWNADPGDAGRGGAGGRGASLDARLGYGWGVLRDRAVTTAFGELGRSGDDDRVRLGVEFRLRGTAGPGLELYGERRGNRPDGLVALKGGFAF